MLHPRLAPVLLVVGLAFAGQALAHAHLLTSDPASGAIVVAPKAVTLHLSETLEPKFSGLELTRDGAPVAAKVSVPASDPKVILAEPSAPLSPGAYKVSWHAVAADGHRTQGAFTVKVK